MAKISTYPTAEEPLLLSDRLIGTEAIRPIPSPTPLATKNFSLQELLDLFSSNFPAATLQAVLNAGNIATQDIFLTGTIDVTSIKPIDIEDFLGSKGTTFQYLSKASTGINWVDLPVDNLQSVLNAGNTATQNINLIGDITSTKIIPGNIQDDTSSIGIAGQVLSKTASGIRWITNPASYTAGLNDVLLVGNTATNNINLIGNYYGDNFYTNTGGYGLQDDGTLLGNAFQFVNGANSYLNYSGLTFNTWTLPNQSGTIALISDIPTGGGIPHTTAIGTDTYTATVIDVTAYVDGDAYLVRFTNGNTTVCTLNINSIGDVPLYRNNDGQLLGGDIWDGGEMLCVYNATANTFQCIGTSPNSLFAYVTNSDTVSITKGQPVYASGGVGDRMRVKRAFNTSDATSAQTVGVVLSTSIGVNQKGIIITQGLLDGLSILPTSTWADGDPVYLAATAGDITNVKQYAPNHLVYLGVVTTASNGSAGRWYVRVQNGYEMNELHDVQSNGAVNKDILYRDTTVTPNLWKPASIPTILGYTPFELPSLTSGSVLFSNGTTIAQDNANFFWDDTNNRLGIGTNSPTARLDIKAQGALSTDIALRVRNSADTVDMFTIGGTGSIVQKSNAFTGTHTIEFAANNYLKFTNSGIGVYMEVGPGNAVSFSGQQLRSIQRGALFGSSIAGSSILSLNALAAQSSGTLNPSGIELTYAINNTGTYVGITRGLYYNPILTSLTGTTHRAIETVTGDVIFGSTSGNVGIGMTPTAKLAVKAQGALSTDIALRVRNSADTADLMTVNGLGNVGIQLGSSFSLNGVGGGNGLISGGNSFLQITNRGQQTITLHNGGNEAQQGIQIGYNLNYNGLPPNLASAIVDITSTTKGFLPPRMTTTQKNAISTPATGLIVYDTTLLSLFQYNGTAWTAVGGSSLPVKLTSQMLTLASWTLVGSYYEYSFSNANIDTTSDITVTPQNASYQTAYNANVLPYVGVSSGVATFYAQFPPQADMVVDIVITQTA